MYFYANKEKSMRKSFDIQCECNSKLVIRCKTISLAFDYILLFCKSIAESRVGSQFRVKYLTQTDDDRRDEIAAILAYQLSSTYLLNIGYTELLA